MLLRNFQKCLDGSRLLYLLASSCSWRKVHWDPCETNADTIRRVTAPNLLGGIISLRPDTALICVNNGRSSARDLPQSASLLMRDSSREWLFLNDSSMWAEQPNRFVSSGSEQNKIHKMLYKHENLRWFLSCLTCKSLKPNKKRRLIFFIILLIHVCWLFCSKWFISVNH